MTSNSTRGFVALATTTFLAFGMTVTACGKDVVNDDVEKKIDEIDDSIKDFIDTVLTTDSSPDTTGG